MLSSRIAADRRFTSRSYHHQQAVSRWPTSPTVGPVRVVCGRGRDRWGDQVALDLGEQREERGHDLRLDVALALDADVLLQGHEGDARLGEGVEHGDDLTQRPAGPGGAGLQGVRQLRPAGGASRKPCPEAVASMKSSMWRSCFPRVLQDGEALAARVLLPGRDAQIGDGLHGLSMQCSFAYCI